MQMMERSCMVRGYLTMIVHEGISNGPCSHFDVHVEPYQLRVPMSELAGRLLFG